MAVRETRDTSLSPRRSLRNNSPKRPCWQCERPGATFFTHCARQLVPPATDQFENSQSVRFVYMTAATVRWSRSGALNGSDEPRHNAQRHVRGSTCVLRIGIECIRALRDASAAEVTREQAVTATGRRRKIAVTRGQVRRKRLGRYIWHTFWAFCGHCGTLHWRLTISSRAVPGGATRTRPLSTRRRRRFAV